MKRQTKTVNDRVMILFWKEFPIEKQATSEMEGGFAIDKRTLVPAFWVHHP